MYDERMKNGLYEHLRVFVAIAQARSFTAASIRTGVGQTTASRQLAALEKHLGVRLLQRSTRSVTLTEQGEIYLQHALRMLEMNDEAEAALLDRGAQLRGRLRVACSNGFGRKLLIPTLERWMAQQPLMRAATVGSAFTAHRGPGGCGVSPCAVAALQSRGPPNRCLPADRRCLRPVCESSRSRENAGPAGRSSLHLVLRCRAIEPMDVRERFLFSRDIW
jgi:DNA-binding transcriptional ArsR family regulator